MTESCWQSGIAAKNRAIDRLERELNEMQRQRDQWREVARCLASADQGPSRLAVENGVIVSRKKQARETALAAFEALEKKKL